MHVVQNLLLILQALIGIAFIVIVISQTTKNEGLTGTIGGNVQTSIFKGKPGFEERLKMWTRNLAIAWFAVSILVGIAFRYS